MALLGFLKPVAYLSLPYLVLQAAAARSPIARYYVRLGVYLSTMGLCSAWGVIVAVGMGLVGQGANVNFVVARSFCKLAGTFLDIQFEVEGEEHLFNTRPAVLLGNHQSMLDILYLGRIFPTSASIMGKKELQWSPLLGQYMTLSGAIFVDRGNNSRAVQSLRAAGETMKARGTSLWMFPEGTRSLHEEPDLLPFKKGAFHLAVQAGVPIIPIVCQNYWHIYRQGVFGSGVLKIKVLAPIDTTSLNAEDVNELAERTRQLMLDALREISTSASADMTESAQDPAESVPPRPLSPQDEPKTIIDERVTPQPQSRDDSRDSLANSTLSDKGTETEEDEGMVLVGRPS